MARKSSKKFDVFCNMVCRKLIFTGGLGKCVNNKIRKAAGIKLITDVENYKDQIFSELPKVKLMVNSWDFSIVIKNKKFDIIKK